MKEIEIGSNLKSTLETLAIAGATVAAYYFLFGPKKKSKS